VRAVLDANILIAALLSRSGAPAQIVRRWLDGAFELVVSEALLSELERGLAYPKLRRRITERDAAEFVSLLRLAAVIAPDRAGSHHSDDPGDDYLLALAENEHAVLVSGGRHLLELADNLPIKTARAFLDALSKL
jgi:putative PIN family toxin of toxin-antitoxin system